MSFLREPLQICLKSSNFSKGKRKLDFDNGVNSLRGPNSSDIGSKCCHTNSVRHKKKIKSKDELDTLKESFSSKNSKKANINDCKTYLDNLPQIESSQERIIEVFKSSNTKRENNYFISNDFSPRSTLDNRILLENEISSNNLFRIKKEIENIDEEIETNYIEEFDKISNTSSPKTKDYEDIAEDPSPIKTSYTPILSSLVRKTLPTKIDFRNIEKSFEPSKLSYENETVDFLYIKPDERLKILINSPFKEETDKISDPGSPDVHGGYLISEVVTPVKSNYNVLTKRIAESCELNFPNPKNFSNLKTKPLRNINHNRDFNYRDINSSNKNTDNNIEKCGYFRFKRKSIKDQENCLSEEPGLDDNLQIRHCLIRDDSKKIFCSTENTSGLEEMKTGAFNDGNLEDETYLHKQVTNECHATLNEISQPLEVVQKRYVKRKCVFKFKRKYRQGFSGNTSSSQSFKAQGLDILTEKNIQEDQTVKLLEIIDDHSEGSVPKIDCLTAGSCEEDDNTIIDNSPVKSVYHPRTSYLKKISQKMYEVNCTREEGNTKMAEEWRTPPKKSSTTLLNKMVKVKDVLPNMFVMEANCFKVSAETPLTICAVTSPSSEIKQTLIEDVTSPEIFPYSQLQNIREKFYNISSPLCRIDIEEDISPENSLIVEKSRVSLNSNSPSTPESKHIIIQDDSPEEIPVSNFHVSVIQECSSESTLETEEKSDISNENVNQHTEDLVGNIFSKSTKKPHYIEEFNKKRIKKGSLIERAFKIAVNLKNEANLFPHEINFGLRSPDEGPLISDKLRVVEIWKEDETYFLKCLTFGAVDAQVSLIVSDLPTDIRLNSVLILHFPVNVVFKIHTLETLVFVKNRITSCNVDDPPYNDGEKVSISLEEKNIKKKIVRTLTNRLSRNILDSVASFHLINTTILELTVLHKCILEHDSVQILQLLTQDIEREYSIIQIKLTNPLNNIHQFIEGNTYEFVGLKLFNINIIDTNMNYLIEYYTLCSPKSNSIYYFQPNIKDWEVICLTQSKPIVNILSTLLTIKHIMSDYKRYKTLVENCHNVENEIRLFDSSLLSNEYIVLKTEIDLSNKLLRVPFILDSVYYLKNYLIFDNYSKILPFEILDSSTI